MRPLSPLHLRKISIFDDLKMNLNNFSRCFYTDKCVGGVMDCGFEWEIGGPGSNSTRVRYIHLRRNAVGADKNSNSPTTYGLNGRTGIRKNDCCPKNKLFMHYSLAKQITYSFFYTNRFEQTSIFKLFYWSHFYKCYFGDLRFMPSYREIVRIQDFFYKYYFFISDCNFE